MAVRKTATQIMKKKAVIRVEIEKRLPHEQADALWRQATEKQASIMESYADLPKGMEMPAGLCLLFVGSFRKQLTDTILK